MRLIEMLRRDIERGDAEAVDLAVEIVAAVKLVNLTDDQADRLAALRARYMHAMVNQRAAESDPLMELLNKVM